MNATAFEADVAEARVLAETVGAAALVAYTTLREASGSDPAFVEGAREQPTARATNSPTAWSILTVPDPRPTEIDEPGSTALDLEQTPQVSRCPAIKHVLGRRGIASGSGHSRSHRAPSKPGQRETLETSGMDLAIRCACFRDLLGGPKSLGNTAIVSHVTHRACADRYRLGSLLRASLGAARRSA